MKQFFKMLFASILGVIIAGFIFMFLSFAILIGIAASTNKEYKLSDNSVFHLELSGQIVDRSQNDIYSNLFSLSGEKTTGLDDILSCIKKAKNDSKIKGILLETDYASIGVSSAKEIRDALLDFKESGKFLIASGGLYSQSVYYIASVADKLILNPSGSVEFRGLTASSSFYKNALDKLGIEIQLVKVGTYKSYAEQYTNTSMSDENREQVSAYINSIWDTMLEDIAASRGVSKTDLNKYADQMMTFQSAEKTLEFQLADTLMYADQVKNYVTSLTGASSEKDVDFVNVSKLKTIPDSNKEYAKEKIAVVYAIGAIDNGGASGDNNSIDSEKLIKTLQSVREDKNVKAVVLRVNSPGGSAYGSEQIWREVSLLKESKPVIVSMGNSAASGGYYISCVADVIVAQPTTLTGSIGIFGLVPNTKGLTDKLGITFDQVKTNEMSDMPSLSRPFTEKEKNLLQLNINQGYELFVKRCADGRGKTTDEIKQIAEGRVWTGKDAQKIGLVDELGGMDKAIEIAIKKTGLTSYRVVEYPEKKDLTTQLMESFSSDAETRILKMQLGGNYMHYINLKNIENLGKVQAIMPFDIVVE